MGVRSMIGIADYLLSVFSVMTILLGFVTFFILPFIGLITPFKGFTRAFLSLAALPINRAAIVVTEQNDLLFKQMEFQNLGLEKISLDGDDKLFEDPDSALHHFLGFSFALADEASGVLFDPRHAAMGMREQELEKKGEAEYLATEAEYDEWSVAKWTKAVYEMPALHELVDLSAVGALIDGGERAEYPERGEEFYKHSRDPFSDAASLKKFIYPSVAFAIPFFGIWIGVTQLGGPAETVSYGASLLWLLISGVQFDVKDKLSRAWAWLKSLDWVKISSGFVLLAMPSAAFVGLALALSPTMAIVVFAVYLLGMAIMPILTVILGMSTLIGGALSKLFFKLGFMGFRRPVITWTAQKYVVKEYDQMDTTQQNAPEWYDLFGSVVGFSYEPGEGSWGAEYVPHRNLESRQPVADGGSRDSNLPAKYVRTQIKRDMYGGYIPKRVSDRFYYLHSGIALSRFTGTASGNKTLRKLLEAKDEHGAADDDVDEGLVFKATVAMGLIGVIAGISIFLLPSFL